MKKVIDNDGLEIEVSDDTQTRVVYSIKTGKKTEYLLTDAEKLVKAEREARELEKKKEQEETKYKELRRNEYNKRGATLETLTVLLWKKEEGEDVTAEIENIRQLRAEVEAMYPKPKEL
jgi:hypothetical protein